ncbi:hypothetical protein RYX36_008464 [Vicia faba]
MKPVVAASDVVEDATGRQGKGLETNSCLNVKWRIINWKLLDHAEIMTLLSKVVAICHEKFDPIVDAETCADIFPSI